MSPSPSSVQATACSVSGQSTPSSSRPSSSSTQPTSSSSEQPAPSSSSALSTHFYSPSWPGGALSTRPLYSGQSTPSSCVRATAGSSSGQPSPPASAAQPTPSASSGQQPSPPAAAAQPAASSSSVRTPYLYASKWPRAKLLIHPSCPGQQPTDSYTSTPPTYSSCLSPARSSHAAQAFPPAISELIHFFTARQPEEVPLPPSPPPSSHPSATFRDNLPHSYNNLREIGPNPAAPVACRAHRRKMHGVEARERLVAEQLARGLAPLPPAPASASASAPAPAHEWRRRSSQYRRSRPPSTSAVHRHQDALTARQTAIQVSEQKLPDYKTPVYVLDSVPVGLPPPPPSPGRTEKYLYTILWVPGREAHMQPFYKYNEVSGWFGRRDLLKRPPLATPMIKTGYWRPARFGGVDCYCWCNVRRAGSGSRSKG